jgi:predicted DNA-binding protein
LPSGVGCLWGRPNREAAMSTTLTIRLPDELATRAKSAAGSRPLADAVLEWIARGVAETPVESMNDDQVSRAAAAKLPDERQAELHDLLADQRESRLTADGRARLNELMAEYRAGLLTKAKAVSEAVRRGLLAAGGHAA